MTRRSTIALVFAALVVCALVLVLAVPRLLDAGIGDATATRWHAMDVRISPDLYFDGDSTASNDVLEVRLRPGHFARPWAGRSLVTFVQKKNIQRVYPFAEWQPCAGCTKFVDTTRAGVPLECFRHAARDGGNDLTEIGCRVPDQRLLVIYRCFDELPHLCDRARLLRDAALQSRPRPQPVPGHPELG